MARSPKILVAAAALAVTTFGLLAVGAPILSSSKGPSDTVLSLLKVTQVEIVVQRLPPELRAAGLSEEDIKARWTRRLTAERFDVADGKGYSKLVLRSIATVDADVPNAVAYAFVISFQQPVHLERLNQTLFVPTFSETLMGQETVAHLPHAAILNINRAADVFINGVKEANRSREEEE